MSYDFTIKQGARFPQLDAVLQDEDGNIISLTGANYATFAMRPLATLTSITGLASIIDAAGGHVRYAWASGDTNIAGPADAEFIVNFTNGELVFPSDDYIRINIVDNLT